MESEFLQWLEKTIVKPANVSVGIGDDAAVLHGFGSVVVATDSIVDGVHFDSSKHDWKKIGHKAIAVNLSDLAAMGAKPTACTLSLIAGAGQTVPQCQQIVQGLNQSAVKYGCPLVGGDFVKHDGPLSLTVTAFGYLEDDWAPWTMTGAEPGDVVLCTGSFGGSIFRKHVEFQPRAEIASQFREQRIQVAAATDVSDGLAGDLLKICRSSSVGAEIQLDKIPISGDAKELAKSTGKTPLQHGLCDGEDFELILVVDESQLKKIGQLQLECPLSQIGRIIETPGIWYREHDEMKRLEFTAYEH